MHDDEPLDLGEIEPGDFTHWESRGTSTSHVFIAGRCVHCQASEDDQPIYGETSCTPHPLTIFTTETPR